MCSWVLQREIGPAQIASGGVAKETVGCEELHEVVACGTRHKEIKKRLDKTFGDRINSTFGHSSCQLCLLAATLVAAELPAPC